MKLEGRTFRDGKWWIIEVPVLDVVTQGKSRKDAYAMLIDALQLLINKKDFCNRSRGTSA